MLDIMHAFNSRLLNSSFRGVGKVGLGNCSREWIAILLGQSTGVMLPGPPMWHRKGL
jgi:hypothetical protein